MEIRYGNENDRIKAEYIWKECFTDSENEVNFYFNEIYKKENFLLLEDGNNEIKASLHENPYEIIINNEKLSSFYIVGVAVSPQYRGRGYMGELIRYSLRNAKEKGLDFVFLSPINTEIYKKYGFGYMSSLEKYTISIENIPFDKIDGAYKIKKVYDERNLYEDLTKVYNKKMKDNFAYLKRDESYYKRNLKEIENENGDIYIFYFGIEPAGYISFYKREENIEIREFFGLDRKVTESMYAFIKTYKEYYSELRMKAPICSNMNFYIHNQVSMKKNQFPFIMGRVVNAENMLKRLHIKDIELKISIVDKIIEENHGVYEITSDGNLIKKKETEYDMEIDISDFNQLIFGYFSLEEMLELERVKINTLEKTEEIKKIFPRQKVYIQEYQ
ncbi:enhanced intracellular survival protein Eis [Fusobacterium sp.]|uniref:GNAT family N-acetyltransferase n=1 Tax=Fusobacterium sp. TaxID=68766 RepID=UPI0028FECA1B|nr:GNAT family N-acetyltransferase [Fusobacterium sp.]MDU1911425.1 GNAT family N-acetyltransferase [Fusobacterium sp.]